MTRYAWTSWAIALVLIVFGLWVVDYSFPGALICIGMALLAMVWVVMDFPPRRAPGG
ncbi:TPA: hypothetical protein ACGCGV_000965 [Stenotrophomonas maltophilia]|uniref:hypothetical protein n=1 Tax=Stenotrophomonas maltophilia TaxID=40324 RepID=UPI0036D6087D